MKESNVTIVLHVTAWAIFFLIPLLLAPPGDFVRAFFDPPNLLSLLFRNALLIAVFYTNYLYLTPVILQKKGEAFLKRYKS